MPDNKHVAGPTPLECGCWYQPNDYHTEGDRLFICQHNRRWKMVLIRPQPFFMPIDITPEETKDLPPGRPEIGEGNETQNPISE